MLELTINGQVYVFNFGMGFLREINKDVSVPVEGVKDVRKNVGLRYAIAGLLDGDMEDLSKVLIAANKGQSPRVTQAGIDSYIDDPDTDVDALFDEVTNCLKSANATRKTFLKLEEDLKKELARRNMN